MDAIGSFPASIRGEGRQINTGSQRCQHCGMRISATIDILDDAGFSAALRAARETRVAGGRRLGDSRRRDGGWTPSGARAHGSRGVARFHCANTGGGRRAAARGIRAASAGAGNARGIGEVVVDRSGRGDRCADVVSGGDVRGGPGFAVLTPVVRRKIRKRRRHFQ